MSIRWVLTAVAAACSLLADAPDAASTPRTRELLAAGKPVTVVCFGDSITGVYYHTGGRRAYPEMLEVALRRAHPKSPVKVVNAGVSGHTTREALKRVERDVLRHKPQLVTVMFGMNDVTRVPLDEFRKNLVEIRDRCRKAGAEVLFCTQNNVLETPARPGKKLAEVTRVIRDLAASSGEGKGSPLALADCHAAFEAVKARDPAAWRLLLSDEIHPNMDGHKLLAETIARAVLGKEASLKDAGPPVPAIPRTLRLLKDGQPVRVLAMPPYDGVIGPALRALEPKAKVEVTAWPTEGKTLAQIEQAARKVRGMKPDLVLVAVPASASAPNPESRIRSYAWVLNHSLSFGQQQWDVVAAPPSTARVKLPPEEQRLDRFARGMIAAQDLSMITRHKGEEDADLERVVVRWLREQTKAGK